MFDKLKDFLKSQANLPKKEQDKILETLWANKKILLKKTYSEYFNHLMAVPEAGSGEYYRERKAKGPSLFFKEIEEISEEEIPHSKSSLQEIIKSFLSIDYIAPSNVIELHNHLFALRYYYEFLEDFKNEIPLSMSLLIDFATLQLIERALMVIPIVDNVGQKADNKRKSRTSKGSKKDDRAQIAIELYYRMDIKGMSCNKLYNKIANDIETKIDKLSKDGRKKYPFKRRPDKKSIERYLLNDEKIKRELKKNE
ncbi:MAG TPA: hypothetical protein VMW09_04555 [Desulfatiglandales bacterium]|nr:hypothetical protein [Desulfatiglandales bacterium]